jgi:hypothetical protein
LSIGDTASASAAFGRALEQSPGHPKASVGEYAIAMRSGDQAALDRARAMVTAAIEELIRVDRHAEAALVAAGRQIADGDIKGATQTLDALLTTAPAGPAGWIIPIDPMLAAIRDNPAKQALFAKLAQRAA